MNKAEEMAGRPPPQKARLLYTEPGWVERVLCLQFPEHHSHQRFCEFTADRAPLVAGAPGGVGAHSFSAACGLQLCPHGATVQRLSAADDSDGQASAQLL